MTETMTEPMSRTLEVPGAVLTYDVRRNASSTDPILMLIGSPMGAAGFGTLAQHFTDRTVVTYDPRGSELGVDTTTPVGELVASVMVSVAQWERRAIGQRTKEALAARKAQGGKLGRPRQLPKAVRQRIVRMRTRGLSLRAIAEVLNDEGVATAQGGARWHASTVRKVVSGGRK